MVECVLCGTEIKNYKYCKRCLDLKLDYAYRSHKFLNKNYLKPKVWFKNYFIKLKLKEAPVEIKRILYAENRKKQIKKKYHFKYDKSVKDYMRIRMFIIKQTGVKLNKQTIFKNWNEIITYKNKILKGNQWCENEKIRSES